ncbi:hypothetical protein FPV33_16005 [Klebsiella aerogenes]|jgi:hypothetical protein|uniref:Uncharacterized protein n=1 Tax=Klebsiella aerogenes (strain ATCC 13048 / DSM 30053 / CCUG 1429 / JCM 1235 / KCTC 2190 / NBRC 13534 / NCIMB 10102 / NCTC 10006 / CDC 819-56) TaxID=1028307 RepID=A0A0H3FUU6_KLEAK|nr:hypothetical protein EAE_15795 [Klebsiella aerogenes KCTC 2190]AUY89120.1 hypothetical protein AL497_25870 [Klebsiella aerogenes]AUZ16968.1 hypothetical protein AL511_26345 [Klebsiella aerogenes]AVF00981.1 hypothetical protein AM441_21140 [Klebsiella aerogenes]AWD05360.1 hypothetical protein AM407_21130 [Klebsiella aerogenes]
MLTLAVLSIYGDNGKKLLASALILTHRLVNE